MSSSLQYSNLARLLAQNNRVHDLEDTLRHLPVPELKVEDLETDKFVPNPLADLQEEVDREIRASLVTCWLAIPEPDEEE